jgi:hypothetical protein
MLSLQHYPFSWADSFEIHLVSGLMMKRAGLSPVILVYQPPPTRMELRDLAWSWPRPVRSAFARTAAIMTALSDKQKEYENFRCSASCVYPLQCFCDKIMAWAAAATH